MVKAKISLKQKKSSKSIARPKVKKNITFTPYSPTEEILQGDVIARAIFECLRDNDPEGVMEMIAIYVKALNKMQAAKDSDLSRSTLYHSLKQKNPTVKTLAKLVSMSANAAQQEVRKR